MTSVAIIGVKISMDGRGRCQDNIFIERLWWTVKYQYLYLHAFKDGAELRHGNPASMRSLDKQASHKTRCVQYDAGGFPVRLTQPLVGREMHGEHAGMGA